MKGMSKSRSEELDYRGLYNQLLQKHNLLKAQFEEVKAQNEEMKAQMKQSTANIADLMQKNHQREVAKSRDNEETTSRVLLKETGGNPRTIFFFACTLYSHSPQR